MNNKLYDALKFVAQIALPAFATFYASLGALWEFPNVDKVVGTIIAFDLFLGVLLGLAKNKYDNSDEKYDGEINVVEGPDGNKVADMQLTKLEDPNAIVDQKEVVFKVNPPA